MVFNYTDQRYDIPCNTVGSSGMNVTWTSTLDLKTKMVNTMIGTSQNGLLEYVNSTFSFMGNDSSIMLTRDNPAGVMFNVTCTTTYKTSFNCRFVENVPTYSQPSQDVLDRCDRAVKSLSTTYSIIIQGCMLECNDTNVVDCNHVPAVGMAMATVNFVCGQNFQWTMGECQPTHCPDLSSATLVTIPRSAVGTNRSAVGTNRSVSCKTGYDNISMPSSVNCQVNGTWTTLPTCQESPSATPEGGGGIGTGAIVGIAVGGAVLAVLACKKQPSSARTCDSRRAGVITEHILDWVVGSLRPLSVVADGEFVKLLKLLEPEYKMPLRTHLAKLLAKRNSLRKSELKALIRSDGMAGVSLTTDQ
ncbi:uncharacterized protein LOC135812974 [Sycon ciliatum]|uniref:uncharacterized protein LOC135812974 n=1 Tax=Sycon ciliatum TaxID=27933 RepID=UPI0031F6FBFE